MLENLHVRRVGIGLLVIAAGCAPHENPGPPPEEMTVIPGGIRDTRPYYGEATAMDAAGRQAGDFLLASCGCGFWRAMISSEDGTVTGQLVVEFYTSGAYEPRGLVTLYGEQDGSLLSGTLDQDAGVAEGEVRFGGEGMRFQAARGENHTDSAGTCVLCHIGEDPILPLPAEHSPYRLDPPNCLDCHSITWNQEDAVRAPRE